METRKQDDTKTAKAERGEQNEGEERRRNEEEDGNKRREETICCHTLLQNGQYDLEKTMTLLLERHSKHICCSKDEHMLITS